MTRVHQLLALISASMAWAGFDVPWGDASCDIAVSLLQSSPWEGPLSQGIGIPPGIRHLPVLPRRAGAGLLRFDPGCPQLLLRKLNNA